MSKVILFVLTALFFATTLGLATPSSEPAETPKAGSLGVTLAREFEIVRQRGGLRVLVK